jgi:hypothetical protein
MKIAMLVLTQEIPMEKHTRGLLADYVDLLNRHGADSSEAVEFIELHKGNAGLMEPADLARNLKEAFTAPACHAGTMDPTTIAAEIQRRLPEIEAELRRRQPEVQEAIRRLREASVVTRETLDLVIDI